VLFVTDQVTTGTCVKPNSLYVGMPCVSGRGKCQHQLVQISRHNCTRGDVIVWMIVLPLCLLQKSRCGETPVRFPTAKMQMKNGICQLRYISLALVNQVESRGI
jgi:hypothetical protein